jgi:hypothetical protein
MPSTPAPTPPASPPIKPKKQQFQTDQSRPFVLPFSPANAGPKNRPRLVPQSIDEAGELYKRNMRVSTELWQTWKLREEYMAEESGITSAEAIAAMQEKIISGETNKAGSRLASSVVDERTAGEINEDTLEEEDEEDEMDPLSMLRRLERSLRAEEDAELDNKKSQILAQKRADVQRLERVELLYVSTPIFPLLRVSQLTYPPHIIASNTAPNAERSHCSLETTVSHGYR